MRILFCWRCWWWWCHRWWSRRIGFLFHNVCDDLRLPALDTIHHLGLHDGTDIIHKGRYKNPIYKQLLRLTRKLAPDETKAQQTFWRFWHLPVEETCKPGWWWEEKKDKEIIMIIISDMEMILIMVRSLCSPHWENTWRVSRAMLMWWW